MTLQFPPIYVLRPPPERMSFFEECDFVRDIPTRTYCIKEAQIILGVEMKSGKAGFELRKLGLYTEEVVRPQGTVIEGRTKRKRSDATSNGQNYGRAKWRSIIEPQKESITIDSSTESEVEEAPRNSTAKRVRLLKSTQSTTRASPEITSSPISLPSPSSATTSIESEAEVDCGDTIKILRLEWYKDSKIAGVLLPTDDYLVYEGKPKDPPKDTAPKASPSILPRTKDVMFRAKADAPETLKTSAPRYKGKSRSQSSQPTITRPTQLVHETTSEHDNPEDLPPLPDWFQYKYSCQRPTPLHSPNDPFIAQLKIIKHWRQLQDDDVGVIAYSRAIASIAAYPHTITSYKEVSRLPYCGDKLAMRFKDWKDRGRLPDVDEILQNSQYQILDTFWNIWDVGDKTALKFYNMGYRSLEDLVEYEWDNLSKTQQIGVKYYDEFLQKIPSREVEFIGQQILDHANRMYEGFQMVIVGSYRRGNTEIGDVDVLLTHPDEAATANFIRDLVYSLGDSGFVTKSLRIDTKMSRRNQETVSWKGEAAPSGFEHTGFDSLDKAFVTWQNPDWPTKAEDMAANPDVPLDALNKNVHRRVDIIISPWKTAGCAIIGWSGGTLFERDLRRYCSKKGLKFDSSGVRSRVDGSWVDLEAGATNLLDKEKKVFERLGLEWREPTERCTG